jgi:hypothetical protein
MERVRLGSDNHVVVTARIAAGPIAAAWLVLPSTRK